MISSNIKRRGSDVIAKAGGVGREGKGCALFLQESKKNKTNEKNKQKKSLKKRYTETA